MSRENEVEVEKWKHYDFGTVLFSDTAKSVTTITQPRKRKHMLYRHTTLASEAKNDKPKETAKRKSLNRALVRDYADRIGFVYAVDTLFAESIGAQVRYVGTDTADTGNIRIAGIECEMHVDSKHDVGSFNARILWDLFIPLARDTSESECRRYQYLSSVTLNSDSGVIWINTCRNHDDANNDHEHESRVYIDGSVDFADQLTQTIRLFAESVNAIASDHAVEAVSALECWLAKKLEREDLTSAGAESAKSVIASAVVALCSRHEIETGEHRQAADEAAGLALDEIGDHEAVTVEAVAEAAIHFITCATEWRPFSR